MIEPRTTNERRHKYCSDLPPDSCPFSFVHGAMRGRVVGAFVLLVSAFIVVHVHPADAACPAMFTGPECATVSKLPTCVDGAFPGTWFTLHKGIYCKT